MNYKQINIWEEGEYSYPLACGFITNITPYLHEDGKDRPCIIVVPGGAYSFVSPSEGEIVAKKFFGFGYNCFVLTYTVNPTYDYPLDNQPMKDLSRAVRFVRSKSKEFNIIKDKLAVCGFSAGGHLCASVCTHFDDVDENNPKYMEYSNRPDAAILCYPVISAGKYIHQGSFDALLGFEAKKERLEYYSVEKHVKDNTPPCFIWQTATDETVPVENSYLFANALKEKGVAFAHHVFSEGKHGLSTADEVYASGEYGIPYTTFQNYAVSKGIKEGRIAVKEEVRKIMEFYENAEFEKPKANKEAAFWPVLADAWLNQYLR